MTPWRYRARDAEGTERTGLLQAESSRAAARELQGMGWVALEIQPQAAGRGGASLGGAGAGAQPAGGSAAAALPSGGATAAMGATGASGATLTVGQLSLSALAPPWTAMLQRLNQPGRKQVKQSLSMMMREMAALLRAGVPLMRALDLSAGASPAGPVRDMLRRIARDLDKGNNLVAAAEREHRQTGMLSSYDVAMLQVGEQTGRLPETFADLHREREFERSTNEQIGAALRYPGFVILTCLAALVVVNLWVIPSFAKVFAQARTELPFLTHLLLGMSNAMVKGWPYGLGALVLVVLGWRRWQATHAGRLWWDARKLRLPIVGPILEGIVLSRLAGALSAGIGAGLTISDALNVTGRTLGNRLYETKVQQMCSELARGASISAAARNMGVLPPTMLQLFAIGEESGSLEELMREISAHYQATVDYDIKRLSSTLEPLLIWFLGMGVLVLALGVFMPMWDLGRATLR